MPGSAERANHVLLVHQLYVDRAGVGGTRHAELAAGLAQRGVRTTVITSGTNYLTGRADAFSADDGVESGVRVLRTWNTSGAGSGFVGRVASFLSFTLASFLRGVFVRDVTLVYGTSPPLPQALTGLALARLKGVPYLLEIRDLWPDFAVALGVLREGWLAGAARRVEAALYRAADAVLVNSPGFVDHVRTRGATDVHVIPNGVDTNGFDPAARGTSWRDRLAGPDQVLFVYAGAHGKPNDLGTVLSAAALVRDDPSIRIALVGGGREKEALVSRAHAEKIDNVIFVDPVPKPEMREVLAAADVGLAVLAPLDLFRTVYPNKVFDYMAAGRPQLLSIDGAAREVVERAGAGTFVPPGDPSALADAIRVVAHAPEARARQGAAGRDWVVRHFERSIHARQLEDLVAALTGQSVT